MNRAGDSDGEEIGGQKPEGDSQDARRLGAVARMSRRRSWEVARRIGGVKGSTIRSLGVKRQGG